LAGHYDDDFVLASKKQIIARLDNHEYESYRKKMKETLLREYLYDYDKRQNLGGPK
jgi:hypothetical protein